MRKFFLLPVFIACLTVSQEMRAQDFPAQPPGNALPSEVAAQNITELTSMPKPGLRYGPGEPGSVNKETDLQNTPVGEIDFSIIMAMGIALVAYTFFKLEKNERRYEKI